MPRATLAPPRSPPGPPQEWLFGNLREFGRDRLGTLSRWAREYGDLVSARFGPRHVVFLNHPDLVEEVLVNQNRKFIKHYRLRDASADAGPGSLDQRGRVLARPAQAGPAGVSPRANRRLWRAHGGAHRANAALAGLTARSATFRTT